MSALTPRLVSVQCAASNVSSFGAYQPSASAARRLPVSTPPMSTHTDCDFLSVKASLNVATALNQKSSMSTLLPPYEDNWIYSLISTTFITVILIVVLSVYYVSRNWRRWKKKALDESFKKTDLDRSGKIDANELYIAVLEFYLELHLYGLNVLAPRRKNVLCIMDALDKDKSGEISRHEFQTVVEILLSQQATRITISIILMLLCPVVATYSSSWLKIAASYITRLFSMELPAAPSFMESVPDSFDKTVICGILMCSINPILKLFDYFFQRKITSRELAKQAVAAQANAKYSESK